MKEDLGTCQSLGASPRLRGAEFFCKGWSSERIPHPSNVTDAVNRRKHFSTQTSPYYGPRALPSKWEDAERWICSPVMTYSNHPSRANYPQIQRKPMSKSGPLFPPAASSSSSSFEFPADAVVPVRRYFPDGAASPFTTGVFIPYAVPNKLAYVESENMEFPAFSELVNYASRDEDSRNISRRDMATQMSSASSAESTIEGESPSPPSIVTIVEPKEHESKVEIREVQVDKRATLVNSSGRCDTFSTDAQRDASSVDYCTWEISEAASDVSKLKREEAKITAWENLQKAKAEAAIRKLEMKLEKKRASSMDKIIRKLKTAESRAKEMRTSISEGDGDEIPAPAASLPLSCAQKNSRFCMLYSCFSSKPL